MRFHKKAERTRRNRQQGAGREVGFSERVSE